MKKIILTLLTGVSFASMYMGVVLLIGVHSENNADKQHTFFPEVQAKIDVYQNTAGGLQRYEQEGSGFWSSNEYYNSSYGSARLSLQGEPSPPSTSVTNVVTIISRDSH